MLEVIFGLIVCGAMYKIAEHDNESGIKWFGVTFFICVLAVLFVPLPWVRFMLAGFIAFGLMITAKFKHERGK